MRRVRGIELAGWWGGGLFIFLGIFEKREENIFCQEEEARPRRGGQGPGRLPGKINEYNLLQPSSFVRGVGGV